MKLDYLLFLSNLRFHSSYFYAAKKLNLTLVTEDMELKSKAEKVGVNTKTTEEI